MLLLTTIVLQLSRVSADIEDCVDNPYAPCNDWRLQLEKDPCYPYGCDHPRVAGWADNFSHYKSAEIHDSVRTGAHLFHDRIDETGSQQAWADECPVQTDAVEYFKPDAFPKNFVWGLGTASYQIEGAFNEDGRGATQWDTFTGANMCLDEDPAGYWKGQCTKLMDGAIKPSSADPTKNFPSKQHQAWGSTGNVANDHYHRYKQDVALMRKLKMPWYRFSIAWSRLCPSGDCKCPKLVEWKQKNKKITEKSLQTLVGECPNLNLKGIMFYRNLLDELRRNSIKPAVTLFHWDLPQGLLVHQYPDGSESDTRVREAGKMGFYEAFFTGPDEKHFINGAFGASPFGIVQKFKEYSELAFLMYGDHVKTWLTFNEAWTNNWLGTLAHKAPSLDDYKDPFWVFVANHNTNLAHLEAVKSLRRFQEDGKNPLLGKEHKIGITNNIAFPQPMDDGDVTGIAAALRTIDATLGSYAEPIYGKEGDYPESLKKMYGKRLPRFTPQQVEEFKKYRSDFFGLNQYNACFASPTKTDTPGFGLDWATCSTEGLPESGSQWLNPTPWGLRQMLNFINGAYTEYRGKPTGSAAASSRETNIPIMVTEYGWSSQASDPESPPAGQTVIYDAKRSTVVAAYTREAQLAWMHDKVNLIGLLPWSAQDNFEWERGYAERFGMVYNDFKGSAPDPYAPGYCADHAAVDEEDIRISHESSADAPPPKCISPKYIPRYQDAKTRMVKDGGDQKRTLKMSVKVMQGLWSTNKMQNPVSFFETPARNRFLDALTCRKRRAP